MTATTDDGPPLVPPGAPARYRRRLEPLLAFLFPSACFGCGVELGARQHLGACLACWAELAPLAPPCCPGCGLPRPRGTDLVGPAGARCASCVLRPSAIDEVRALVAYDRVARRFVLRAKGGRRPELLHALGRLLARAIEIERLAEGATVVVPAPSHPWMGLRRGFSPAAELARPLARRLGLRLDLRALVRCWRSHTSARGLSAASRRRRAQAGIRATTDLVGQRVLLVDDVMTSGATLEACATALKAAGAAAVRGAVWARVVGGR